MSASSAGHTPIPTILFGAFDRHNFGDLLFPHIAAALLEPEHPVFAGLVERDLRSCGGHHVEALAGLAARWRDHPVNILHAGGELLTCDAWQAAVMTLPPEEAQDTILRFLGRPHEALEWARRRTGIATIAPYTVPRSLFPHARAVIYNAVGGVDLDGWDQAYREEVMAKLRTADAIGVRDTATAAHLHAAGIATCLMPDPAVMVAELFGEAIRRRTEDGEILHMRQAFPQGYVAVQFNADFGDDATLSTIARQLDNLLDTTGLGTVFFRAGAAPWHDDLACYERVAARMRNSSVKLFTSLDLWDICALISASHGYLGSSLHGRIVAMAFSLPRLNFVRTKEGSKQEAFASTWEDASVPHAVQLDDIADGMQQAMAVDAASLRLKARQLVDGYRQGFQTLCDGFFSSGES